MWARHDIVLDPLAQFDEQFFIGRGREDARFWKGELDDVRIYNWALAFADINNLAYETGEPNPPPVYWYKLDDGSGLIATDSGYGAEVYKPVMSKANLTDPESQLNRSVNFKDYGVMAEHWLREVLWPPEP